MTSIRSPTAPPWMRLAVPGEKLDPRREKFCVNPRCAAVFSRVNLSAESWANKVFCCAACFNGHPPIPAAGSGPPRKAQYQRSLLS